MRWWSDWTGTTTQAPLDTMLEQQHLCLVAHSPLLCYEVCSFVSGCRWLSSYCRAGTSVPQCLLDVRICVWFGVCCSIWSCYVLLGEHRELDACGIKFVLVVKVLINEMVLLLEYFNG